VSPNPRSVAIERKRNSGVPLLDLTIANPTAVFGDYPHAAIAHALGGAADATYRPNPFGEEQARSSIAESYASRSVAVSLSRLALTASTSEAYALLFKLLCDPGDEILVPLPSYPLFEYLAALESVRVAFYRLAYDGSWFIDLESVRERLNERTRAIVIVNPNNPTGSFLKRREAESLFCVAAEHGLPLISDEVFMDYPIAPAENRVSTLIGNDSVLSFSLNGLSKSAGMPQMKLGWIAINGGEREYEAARERLELILDTYLSVNTPVQHALPQLMRIGAGLRDRIRQRTQINLQVLASLLRGSPCHLLHVEGGWSAIVQLPKTLSEDTWAAKLIEERNVIVQPGYFFDMPSEPYMVVSLITPVETFRQGIDNLRELVSACA
jgi:alanine-synthesizing transaminase